MSEIEMAKNIYNVGKEVIRQADNRIAELEQQLAEAQITIDHLQQEMCPKSSDCPYSDMGQENKRLRETIEKMSVIYESAKIEW